MNKPEVLREKDDTDLLSWKFRLLNMGGFQLGWFACVLGTASDNPWIGPLLVGFLAVMHLIILPFPSAILRLILLSALLGTALDGLLIFSNVFSFTGTSLPVWLSPLWLTAMWVNFSLTLPVSMSWLLDRYWLGAVLGAVGGPAAYFAGMRLGAIEFQAYLPASLLLIGCAWSGAMPLLLYWARKGAS